MGAAILVGIIPVGRLLRRICLEELVEFVSVGTAALLVVVRKLDDYNVARGYLRLDGRPKSRLLIEGFARCAGLCLVDDFYFTGIKELLKHLSPTALVAVLVLQGGGRVTEYPHLARGFCRHCAKHHKVHQCQKNSFHAVFI